MIVHLTVIIILLLAQITSALRKDNSFVIDFSRQEKEEEIQRQEQFNEDIVKRIDDMIAGRTEVPLKNVATDRGNKTLKDDRNTDADKLYEDAKRLQDDLKRGVEVENEEDYAAVPDKSEKKKDEVKKAYSGPSVLSWELEGRKARRLPIPAYKCFGGGMVTVVIWVDRSGKVVQAKVEDALSTADNCLRDYALRAAKLSSFSASQSAPERQGGNIVYQFISQ